MRRYKAWEKLKQKYFYGQIRLKMSGKNSSELHWTGDEVQLLLKATKT